MAVLKDFARRLGIRRGNVASARMRIERTRLSSSSTSDNRARILAYHSVGTPSWGVNDVTPVRFERQLRLAIELGHNFVPASLIASGEGQPGDLSVTFDDGMTTVAQNAAPILAGLGIPWTIFTVSEWLDGNHEFEPGLMLGWDALGELSQRPGVAIGSHSMTHPRFGAISEQQAREELNGSRAKIEKRLGISVESFAIPFGQSTDWPDWCGPLASEAGYRDIYAQAEHTRPAHTVPRTFVSRFDNDRIFAAALRGAFDTWEEWV